MELSKMFMRIEYKDCDFQDHEYISTRIINITQIVSFKLLRKDYECCDANHNEIKMSDGTYYDVTDNTMAELIKRIN